MKALLVNLDTGVKMKTFKDLKFKQHKQHSQVIYATEKIGAYTLWAFTMKDSDYGEILGNRKQGTYEICCASGKNKLLPLTREYDSLPHQTSQQVNDLMKRMQTKGVKRWAQNLKQSREKFDKAKARNAL